MLYLGLVLFELYTVWGLLPGTFLSIHDSLLAPVERTLTVEVKKIQEAASTKMYILLHLHT